MTADSQITTLNNEVKLKAFEAERTQLVHEETCHVLKQTQLDNEKLHSKLDVSDPVTYMLYILCIVIAEQTRVEHSFLAFSLYVSWS